jgi:hypothetical protein
MPKIAGGTFIVSLQLLDKFTGGADIEVYVCDPMGNKDAPQISPNKPSKTFW